MTSDELNQNSVVTMSDVAQEAGLTRQTVSKYLNGDKTVKRSSQKLIDAACEKLNYVPNIHAVNLAKRESNIIGMIVPAISDPFFGEIIHVVENEANKNGLHLLCQCSYKDALNEERIIKSFRSLNVCAFIIAPVGVRPNRVLLKSLEKSYPVIYIENHLRNNSHYVISDNVHSISMITKHFLSIGSTPAYLDHPYKNFPIKSRQDAYLQVKEEHGQEPVIVPVFHGDFTWQTEKYAYENVRTWLQQGKIPDGLICASDRLAIGAMKAFQERGIQIGKDILVSGHDDITISAYLSPALTTVKQPKEKMGKAAVKAALEQIQTSVKKPKWVQNVFKSELILRESA